MSQCSNCSAPVLPVVAIDIDGTLSEYHRSLTSHVERYFNIKAPSVDWNGDGDFEDHLGVTHDQYREAKLAYRQGGFKRWATPMAGVNELAFTIERLKRTVGVEIWITTTRPWNRLDSTDPDTRFWLDKHFPVYDHLLYHDHKYLELARILGGTERVVAVVDDLPSMWLEARETFGKSAAHLIMRPHNREYRLRVRPHVAMDLAEFASTIEKGVVLWHNRNVKE